MSEQLVAVSLTINGQTVQRLIEPRLSLVDFLRHEVELTGTHVGCEMGLCGACLVLLDGEAVHSCLMFAVQADGLRIETIEGLAERGAIAELQAAFLERNALQCGFCTPGMLVTAHQILAAGGRPSREAIREALSGNYCRCTGYHAIVDAIETVVNARADASPAPSPAEESIA
jgi:aerobic carbon-monoxide dehydrogenase small subunit